MTNAPVLPTFTSFTTSRTASSSILTESTPMSAPFRTMARLSVTTVLPSEAAVVGFDITALSGFAAEALYHWRVRGS